MTLKLLTAKDVANQLNVSIPTAKRYIKDIKETFGIKAKKITQENLNRYFGITD